MGTPRVDDLGFEINGCVFYDDSIDCRFALKGTASAAVIATGTFQVKAALMATTQAVIEGIDGFACAWLQDSGRAPTLAVQQQLNRFGRALAANQKHRVTDATERNAAHVDEDLEDGFVLRIVAAVAIA
jgi:beta-lactamase class D